MKIRLISLVLLLVMIAACFIGCNTGNGETTAKKPAASTPNDEKVPEGIMALVEKNASKYQIVYPLAAEASAQMVAEQLSELIMQKTGVKIPVVKDQGAKETEYEIRIGKVGGRMDALKVFDAYRDLTVRDFAVEVHGNHVYIYGSTALAISTAMEYFIQKVLYVTSNVAGVEKGFSLQYREEACETVLYTGAEENYAYFTLNPGKLSEAYLRISFSDNNGWRLQTKNSASEEFNELGASQRLAYSLGEMPPLNVYPITPSVDEENKTVTLYEDGGTHVTINLDDFEMNFYSVSGECSATITNITSTLAGACIEGKINPNEAIYGTGERFNAVNQRGQKINMFTKDIWSQSNACYMVIPLLCFSRGSGVFLNIYEEMDLTLGAANKKTQEDTWKAEINGTTIDCYIFATEQMSDAIRGYTDLSGHAEQPEEWTYGMLIARYSPDLTQKWTFLNSGENTDGRDLGVYDAIAYYEAYDLPWTGVLAEGWGPYKSAKYDDLKELCDYVHSKGKKILMYMRVGTADSGMGNFSNDYLVEMIRPDGTTTTMLPAAGTNNPDTAGATDLAYPYLDVSNPAACDWFFNEVWHKISVEVGVDGCKIDFCETLPEYYELNYYDDNLPTSGSHHWYPVAFCAKFFEMISSKPDSGMCFSRGGGIGSQRSPYMWAGDQVRQWEAIGWQLNAVLSSGMSGVPFMSYDMSGYQYGRDYPSITINGGYKIMDPQYEAKVFIRGLQYSAFATCLQTHGKVRHVFEFADGDILKKPIYKTVSGEYTLTVASNNFVRWCKVTTGGLDSKTGYYKGINPLTGNLYEWEYNEDGTVQTVDVYSYKDKNDKVKYTLEKDIKDKDGNVIGQNTFERTVKVTDGSFDTNIGYYTGYGITTGKLESDGIKYVYEIAPGAMSYVTDIYRGYMKLHELLTPYITELSAEACETGMPVARILALMWQDDVNVYDICDQYMFGDAFMIAPVLEDADSRDIYLPEGEWVDLMTGKEYTITSETPVADRWIRNYEVSLAELPVFYNKNTTSAIATELVPGILEIFDYLGTIKLPAA